MIDVFNILDSSPYNQVFYTIGADDWQTWNKPTDAQMVGIFCLGGGGGGGAGQNGAAGTTRQGGGGGGAAGYSFGIFPANQIPDILYIQTGPGGPGGHSLQSLLSP